MGFADATVYVDDLFYHESDCFAGWVYMMTKNYLGWVIVIAGLMMTTSVSAAESWGGEGQLGFVLARGNSDADTVNAKLDMSKETVSWKNAFGIAALRSSSDGERNAERSQHHGRRIIASVRVVIGTVVRATRTIDLVALIIKRAW